MLLTLLIITINIINIITLLGKISYQITKYYEISLRSLLKYFVLTRSFIVCGNSHCELLCDLHASLPASVLTRQLKLLCRRVLLSRTQCF